jgi:hypothetical protein
MYYAIEINREKHVPLHCKVAGDEVILSKSAGPATECEINN